MKNNLVDVQTFINQLQDDDLVDLLIVSCKVYKSCNLLNHTRKDAVEPLKQSINAHSLFYFMLQKIDFDYCFLVDWLMSGDTNILEYLLL